MSGTRRKPGRMGAFVEGYRVWLLEAGYTPQTTRGMLMALGQLGRWMDRTGVEVGEVDVAAVESFLASLRADGHRRVPTVRALGSLLGYLREVGVMASEDGVGDVSPVDAVVGEYRQWLLVERELAVATVLRYETLARRFLSGRVSCSGELEVEGLSGADVSAFLLGECERLSIASAKGKVAELRSLLRFLHMRGFTAMALADSVPSVAGWRETEIPPTMARADIERLLACCEPSTLAGARNFAMLMLLARLGLRSIEVARLELGDVDWRAGELIVRGKARRQDRLPLPDDVGEALATYLSLRGRRDSRRVFLTVKAQRVRSAPTSSATSCSGPAPGPASRTLGRIGCATRSPARCWPAERRLWTSARSCATAIWRQRRSTPRSISHGCVRSPSPGQEPHDDRARAASR